MKTATRQLLTLAALALGLQTPAYAITYTEVMSIKKNDIAKQKEQRLLSLDDGLCFFAKAEGTFLNFGDIGKVFVRDNYWYVKSEVSQRWAPNGRSNIIGAICITYDEMAEKLAGSMQNVADARVNRLREEIGLVNKQNNNRQEQRSLVEEIRLLKERLQRLENPQRN